MNNTMSDDNDPELAALFAAERGRSGPPKHVEDRVHAAVLESVTVAVLGGSALAAGSAAAGSAAAGSATTATSSAGLGAWAGLTAMAKPTALVMAAAVTTWTGGYVVSRMDVAPPAGDVVAPVQLTVPVQTPASTSPVPMLKVATPEAQPRPAANRSVTEPVRVGAAPVAVDNDEALAAERAMLARAKASLAAGDAGGALIALARGATRLQEEHQALLIFALADAGRAPEANAKLRTFVQRYPKSLFLNRLQQRLSQPADPID
jgi:hypothetical protein